MKNRITEALFRGLGMGVAFTVLFFVLIWTFGDGHWKGLLIGSVGYGWVYALGYMLGFYDGCIKEAEANLDEITEMDQKMGLQ